MKKVYLIIVILSIFLYGCATADNTPTYIPPRSNVGPNPTPSTPSPTALPTSQSLTVLVCDSTTNARVAQAACADRVITKVNSIGLWPSGVSVHVEHIWQEGEFKVFIDKPIGTGNSITNEQCSCEAECDLNSMSCGFRFGVNKCDGICSNINGVPFTNLEFSFDLPEDGVCRSRSVSSVGNCCLMGECEGRTSEECGVAEYCSMENGVFSSCKFTISIPFRHIFLCAICIVTSALTESRLSITAKTGQG